MSSGALRLLLGEAGVVDEQLGAAGGLDRRLRRGPVSPVITTVRPGRGLPHHLLGRDRARGALDRLAALQRGEGRAFGHAEPLRRLEVEAARALVLDQRVAAGADAVLDLEGADLGALELDHVARLELDQVELEADPPDQRPSVLNRSLRGRAARRR